MQKFKDWKKFINRVLIESEQFEKLTSELINQTEIETYKSTKKKSLTEIKVGYYVKDGTLIFINIFNPTVPGYNEYIKQDYFCEFDFTPNKSYGNPGLEFNEQNRNGVLSKLEEKLIGKEIHFVKNNKILKAKLYITEYGHNFNSTYDFTKRNFWKKLLGKKIEKMEGIEKREVELNKIFSGIKNVSQHRA
jgi:hypothetical protein